MKLFTTKFKSGGLHEKHVVATRNLGNHLSICFWAQGNQEKPVSRWPVAGPSELWPLASSPAFKVKKKNTHSTTNTHKITTHTSTTTIHTVNQQQLPKRQLKTRNKTPETNYNTTCTKGKNTQARESCVQFAFLSGSLFVKYIFSLTQFWTIDIMNEAEIQIRSGPFR